MVKNEKNAKKVKKWIRISAGMDGNRTKCMARKRRLI